MNFKIILIVVILLLVFAGSRWRQTPSPTPAEEVFPTEVKKLTVVGDEYRFQPPSVSLKSGERVELTFKNNGQAPHNLIIEGLMVETKTIGGGQQDIIEFTAPTEGTDTFFCSVPGHRAAGMEGNLEVK